MLVLPTLTRRIKGALPRPIHNTAKNRIRRLQASRSGVARVLADAPITPARLDGGELALLDRLHPPPLECDVSVDWTDDARMQRAGERLQLLMQVLGDRWEQSSDVLEVGAGDGLTSLLIARTGRSVTANDIHAGERDARVSASTVTFLESPAEKLPIEDESFDLVVSFDAFEHFGDPGMVLDEAMRVLQPGGSFYTYFGPLYRSADGLHGGSRLAVPFATVLFDKETIDEFLATEQRESIQHSYCNEWTLDQFRQLVADRESDYADVQYWEHYDVRALDVIKRYPSCFKAVSGDPADFLVAGIELSILKH